MRTSDAQVVIIGAGIAGLALARALRQRDIAAVVLDRLPGPPRTGLALNLPGNAVHALGLVGVGTGLAGLGEPVRRREYRNAKDRLLFAVDEEAFWDGQGRPRIVRRPDLLDLLGGDLPSGTIRWDSAVTSVRSEPGGAEVVLADGRVERCALVVGADGVHSAVRPAILAGVEPRASVLSAAAWRFMAPNPGVDHFVVWSNAAGAFLLIPLDDGEVYGFASATGGGAVDADPTWLRETFAGFPGPVREVVDTVLADPRVLHHSPIEEVRIPRWSRDRAVLVGDAAHATAPVWAQGAAMAVEDAIVLADLLATHGDWSLVGTDYERHRRPRVAHVQSMTDRLSRAAGLPDWIRNMILPFVGPRSYRETYGPLKAWPSTPAAVRAS
jgi:2-polyprenyl-6-methoxyphenol hydroxylase-like FAD-dependent oxidoreductase